MRNSTFLVKLAKILVKEVNLLHFQSATVHQMVAKVALQPLLTNTSHLIIGLCQELVEVEQQVATSLPFRQAWSPKNYFSLNWACLVIEAKFPKTHWHCPSQWFPLTLKKPFIIRMKLRRTIALTLRNWIDNVWKRLREKIHIIGQTCYFNRALRHGGGGHSKQPSHSRYSDLTFPIFNSCKSSVKSNESI